MEVQDMNPWLQQKRLALIGCDKFVPRDYGHLLWYWGVISDQFRLFLKKYGRLRGLILASQGRVVTWTYCNTLYSRRSRSFSEKERIKIENQWRCLVNGMNLKEINLLDWLTQDPVDYNVSRQEIICKS